MIQYTCSKCKAALESSDRRAGKTDPCPVCQTPCIVPLPNIKYKCPNCAAPLETLSYMGGKEDSCPKCGRKSIVPLSRQQKQEKLLEEAKKAESAPLIGVDQSTENESSELLSTTKLCSFCAETINSAAIKCRYCQSDLKDPSASSAGPTEHQGVDRNEKPVRKTLLRRLGSLVLLGIVVFVVLVGVSIAGVLISQSYEPSIADQKKEEQRQFDERAAIQQVKVDEQARQDAITAAQRIKDEADEMRAQGFGNAGQSDKELAQFYERLKAAADENQARKDRLNRE